MKLILITTILMMSIVVSASGQGSVASEIDTQRKILADLEMQNKTVELLNQQVSVLKQQIDAYVQMLDIRKSQVDLLHNALDDRKLVEELHKKQLDLKNQEIGLYKRLAEEQSARADRLEKSKNRRGILFGLVGILFGSFL